MALHPVILCGGSGARLWPASRPSRPKQFIRLTGPRSPFQETVLRLTALEAERPLIVSGAAHVETIRAQLAEVDVEAHVLVEPEGRDSAPAIAAAAEWIVRSDPQGVAVVVASDHHIPDAAAFGASVRLGAPAAAAGRLVTFGVTPDGPATAYGYIERGEPLPGLTGVFALARFIEKPDAARASGFVEAGYLWNSGNFMFSAAVLLGELDRFAPEIRRHVVTALDQARTTHAATELGSAFKDAPKISIDYAVMEKTDRAAVAPVAFEWSDIGAWDQIWAVSQKDRDGNALAGDVLAVDSRNSLVRAAGGARVVTVGVEDVAVVVEPDAVLVCALGQAQAVKGAVDRLTAADRADAPTAGADSLGAATARMRRWFEATALPVWWTLGADRAHGGYVENLDVDTGRPVSPKRRVRVQARQAYVYATAGAMGWPGPWAQAVEHGVDSILSGYRRPDGQFRAALFADGAPPDETAMLYDQAFVLFGLAAAARALPARAAEMAAEAEALLAAMQAARRHGAGGFTEAGGPTPFQANPHMHLFEAVLAWCEQGAGAPWDAAADELAELCLSRFIQSDGALREMFDAHWRPLDGVEGRVIEPGHQFEWAWLLERWGRLRGRADSGPAARRLFEAGVRGVDAARNVAMNALLDDGSPHDRAARLWPQTEWIKAALVFDPDGPGPGGALSAARALEAYLQTPVPGLWRDWLQADGRFVESPAPASSFYHIAGAIAALAAHHA